MSTNLVFCTFTQLIVINKIGIDWQIYGVSTEIIKTYQKTSSLTFAFKATSFVSKLAFAQKRTQGVDAVSIPMTGVIHGLTFVYIWAMNTNVSEYLWYSLKEPRHSICYLSKKIKDEWLGLNLSIGTVSCRLLTRMTEMDMDWNLIKLESVNAMRENR